jgi:hypothetical protein
MRYTFKSDDVICYSIPKIGTILEQFTWFAKWGERAYNFHKYEQMNFKVEEQYWKYTVAKSKVVQGLYK